MTLKQLEYFLAIAEIGHITKAAEKLNMSQPPLSYQLKLLESELGSSLFIREGRNLKITQEGIFLHKKASQILKLVDNTVSQIQHLGLKTRGIINIGTVSSISARLLPHVINEYSTTHPDVDFNLFEGTSIHIMELLDNGVIEVGMIREPFNSTPYHSILVKDKILDDQDHSDYFVAVAKDSFFKDQKSPTIALRKFRNIPIIIHDRYEDLFLSSCLQNGFQPRIICRNNDVNSSLSWAASGIGVAIVPYTSSTLLAPAADILVKKIVSPTLFSNSYLIWNKDTHISHITKDFIEMFS